MLAVTSQIHALFTIPAASAKHLYPSLESFPACATSFLVFPLNVLIMERSISWDTVNKTHFECEENYRNSINGRSRPECLATVYTMFLILFLDPQLHIIM